MKNTCFDSRKWALKLNFVKLLMKTTLGNRQTCLTAIPDQTYDPWDNWVAHNAPVSLTVVLYRIVLHVDEQIKSKAFILDWNEF